MLYTCSSLLQTPYATKSSKGQTFSPLSLVNSAKIRFNCKPRLITASFSSKELIVTLTIRSLYSLGKTILYSFLRSLFRCALVSSKQAIRQLNPSCPNLFLTCHPKASQYQASQAPSTYQRNSLACCSSSMLPQRFQLVCQTCLRALILGCLNCPSLTQISLDRDSLFSQIYACLCQSYQSQNSNNYTLSSALYYCVTFLVQSSATLCQLVP